jgi:F-BAR domain only protein
MVVCLCQVCIRLDPMPGPVAHSFPVAPEKHTSLGGLKRLGTVMNRRKSIVQAPGGGHVLVEKKSRAPFGPFRRADSSRDIHQVGSPSSPGPDSVTSQATTRHSTLTPESTRGTSDLSRERDEHNAISVIPEVPATANGTSPANHKQPEESQPDNLAPQVYEIRYMYRRHYGATNSS